VVVTDKSDWGGWRTPGAEYDRDPRKIEYQARLIMSAPRLLGMAQAIIELVDESAGDAPAPLRQLAEQAASIQRYLAEVPAVGPAAMVDAAE